MSLDVQLMQLDRQLGAVSRQAEICRDEVRTYRLALTMGPAADDRAIRTRSTHLKMRLEMLRPQLERYEQMTRTLSRRTHRSGRAGTSAHGRLGNVRGQSLPEAQKKVDALEEELNELRAELDRRFGDPTRVPTPVDGVLDVLNAVIEMMALLLKARKEERGRNR